MLLLIQLYQPEIVIVKPRTIETNSFPNDVQAILVSSCYDCHSDSPNLQWFDEIAPISWLVASHINDARKVLNFSNWDDMNIPQQNVKMWQSINRIITAEMPLKSYVSLHQNAKVSAEDILVLKDYVTGLAPKITPDVEKSIKAGNQFKAWNNGKVSQEIPVDINGIAYIPDYKNWIPISTSQRFDNGTMRIIFGNSVAIDAIRKNNTNPWPNGSIIAKVAWDQLMDEQGNIYPGEFKQVEYMIKDSDKYKDTQGWGWARFRTPRLEPYGDTKTFTQECINCHLPMKDNDFVFTEPFKTSK